MTASRHTSNSGTHSRQVSDTGSRSNSDGSSAQPKLEVRDRQGSDSAEKRGSDADSEGSRDQAKPRLTPRTRSASGGGSKGGQCFCWESMLQPIRCDLRIWCCSKNRLAKGTGLRICIVLAALQQQGGPAAVRQAWGLASFCMAGHVVLYCKVTGLKQLNEERDGMQPCTDAQPGVLLVWC